MRCTVSQLPKVHPHDGARRFNPLESGWAHFRDKVMFMEGDQFQLEVEEIGMADTRLPFDEDVVDQSGAVFELTSRMMMAKEPKDIMLAVFTSRRWRNHRWMGRNEKGEDCEWPTPEEPLLFIGNPYIIEREGWRDYCEP